MFIHQILLKKTDLAHLNSDLDKLEFDKLKDIPSNLSNLKSKLDKLDIGKLELNYNCSSWFKSTK